MEIDPALYSPEAIRECASACWEALGKRGRDKLTRNQLITLSCLMEVMDDDEDTEADEIDLSPIKGKNRKAPIKPVKKKKGSDDDDDDEDEDEEKVDDDEEQ